MTESIIPTELSAPITLKERAIDRVSRQVFMAMLKRIRKGKITLIENDQQYRFGERSPTCGLSAEIHVQHPRFIPTRFSMAVSVQVKPIWPDCGQRTT